MKIVSFPEKNFLFQFYLRIAPRIALRIATVLYFFIDTLIHCSTINHTIVFFLPSSPPVFYHWRSLFHLVQLLFSIFFFSFFFLYQKRSFCFFTVKLVSCFLFFHIIDTNIVTDIVATKTNATTIRQICVVWIRVIFLLWFVAF